jgi:Spy/CpxP family protein refolding chaperone
MKKYTYLIAALIAVLLVAGLVFAADQKDEKPGFWGPGGKLNLTTEQKGKLIDLQEKLFNDQEKISDEIVKKDFQMKKLFLADTPDIKAIDKIQDEIKALNDKRITLLRDFRTKARALLTAEQLKADPYAFMGPGGGMGIGPCPGMMGPGFGPGTGMGGGWHHERWGDRD